LKPLTRERHSKEY